MARGARPRRHPAGPTITAALALALGASCAAAPVVPRQCEGGLQGSFLQLTDRQLGFGARDFMEPFALLRATGADTLILQYTGDGTGAYEDRRHARLGGPVRAVLSAAAATGLRVYLGLHADPRWPSDESLRRLPPPLDDSVRAQALGELCRTSEACAGWYLPGEIDDQTWADPERTRALAVHLWRSAAALRALAPGRPVMIAPFYSGRQDPQAHARWWAQLMAGRPFDVLALQDGVGTGRVSPERAAAYLRALAPVAAASGVRLWSVVELFRQLHGTPRDDRPFRAEAASFSTVRRSLQAQRPLVEQAIGFAVLDYMNPQGSRKARRLYNSYVGWCESAPETATPPPAPPAVLEEPTAAPAASLSAKKGT
jgi:hypothetical protein